MKILLVGSGGREHALAWKLRQSPLCKALYCAPGNAGIAEIAEIVKIGSEDVEGLCSFAKDKGIDFVVVGPEAPLVAGLVDRLREEGILAFGPSAKAAQIEGSKGFMKDLCAKYAIPTAAYGRFSDLASAEAFIATMDGQLVVKADGLAAGKGVIICSGRADALDAARDMLEGGVFGDAGAEIVIEEFLDGEEVSFFALSDGRTIVPLVSAQDHKRVGEGDSGPNTGGMGAYSPAYFMTKELESTIISRIIEPTIRGMAAEGCSFTGVLFAGLMVKDGVPKLLEHNARFGDPECQTLMLRMEGDLVKVLKAAAEGRLESVREELRWSDDAAMCVVMAANGYPGPYAKGTPISGDLHPGDPDVRIFHAGTARGEDGQLVSQGGRVLGVCAKGKDIAQAQKKAYAAVDGIVWPEGFCRRDIGWRAIKAQKGEAA
ncbi:MAG: phosphoribosylamine--glycine ligase [Alphaproteobacteria bacterium]|nr:phosphoribosylamine--glycine ligase [Alphaproteobacteria bacterium]MCB9975237.1 phosphoribosylamine--glycine ligase [Rhodospirillales bacterium]